MDMFTKNWSVIGHVKIDKKTNLVITFIMTFIFIMIIRKISENETDSEQNIPESKNRKN